MKIPTKEEVLALFDNNQSKLARAIGRRPFTPCTWFKIPKLAAHEINEVINGHYSVEQLKEVQWTTKRRGPKWQNVSELKPESLSDK